MGQLYPRLRLSSCRSTPEDESVFWPPGKQKTLDSENGAVLAFRVVMWLDQSAYVFWISSPRKQTRVGE
jgi:hypothetical protein